MGITNDIKIIARQIAQKLDELDGKDNKISSETWKKHAVSKFGAKDNVNIYISVFYAEKSIALYLKRNANDNDIKDIGQNWLDSLSKKTPENEPAKDIAKTETTHLTSLNNDKYLNALEEKAVSTQTQKPVIDEITLNTNKDKASKKLTKMIEGNLDLKVYNLIRQEIEKLNLDSSKIDISYWSEKIASVSKNYDIPYKLLVSIISRETRFTKNASGKNGHGAMQLTTIAIKSFFPSTSYGWNKIYQQMDNKLMNDILYVKDSNGKFKTDSNGNKILKYKNPTELLKACGKDDELSMKVGTLIFEMKYAEAVAAQRYGKGTFANIPKVIAQLQSGNLKLSTNENTICIGNAVRNYNGNKAKIKRNGKYVAVREDYRREVMDSLKVNGYNFAEQIITKQA